MGSVNNAPKYSAFLRGGIVCYDNGNQRIEWEYWPDVDNPPNPDPQADPQPHADVGSLRSPVRPSQPDTQPAPKQPSEAPARPATPPDDEPDDPQAALEDLRAKMEWVAAEYAKGRLNRAQFNAIYQHYSEKRTIIERLLERNPGTDAWKQVAQAGHTMFLRAHFEARPLFYAVFAGKQTTPLIAGGKQTPRYVEQIGRLVRTLWSTDKHPETGLARKDIGDGQWLVIALGKFGVTFVVFSLQPSTLQANLVNDLHADFERANQLYLERGVLNANRMVFPQRSLIP